MNITRKILFILFAFFLIFEVQEDAVSLLGYS